MLGVQERYYDIVEPDSYDNVDWSEGGVNRHEAETVRSQSPEAKTPPPPDSQLYR
ncbi:MAG TPA: hypothetical protein VEG43_00385 [Dehalococcoidia bacterium]|nr:hypothetical protein [Dehalococcoidia bacterium]